MSVYDENTSFEGGSLWRVLSIEEDLLQAVLLHLDYRSLMSLELTCTPFRKFMQRTLTWKKVFEAAYPTYSDDTMDKNLKVMIKRCINRTKGLHLKYKYIVLRLKTLEANLAKGTNSKDKINFPKVVGPNGDLYMIRSMDSQSIFIHDEGEFYPSQIFNIETKTQHKLINDTYDMFSIKSSDVCNCQLVVLRESDIHLNGTSEMFYVIETYMIPTSEEKSTSLACKLKEQSDSFAESVIGICVKVKLALDTVLLLSIKKENQIMHATVNIFTTAEEKLVSSGQIFCALPENAFSEKLSLLNNKHFITCRPGRRFVDIWDLNKIDEYTKKAEMIWEKEVINSKSIPIEKCSAIAFSFPHLLVGKSNGRCDIWNTHDDCIIRSLEHGLETGLNMGIHKIAIFSDFIYSLTDSGWLFAWDRKKSFHPKIRKEKSKNFLSWVIKNRKGKDIINFEVDHTKMVTIEKHQAKSVWQSKMFLVIRDFWNHREKNCKQIKHSTNKRKAESSKTRVSKRLKSEVRNRNISEDEDVIKDIQDKHEIITIEDEYEVIEIDEARE